MRHTKKNTLLKTGSDEAVKEKEIVGKSNKIDSRGKICVKGQNATSVIDHIIFVKRNRMKY